MKQLAYPLAPALLIVAFMSSACWAQRAPYGPRVAQQPQVRQPAGPAQGPVVPGPPPLQQAPVNQAVPVVKVQPRVRAPFQLTPEEEHFLDQVLLLWEQESDRINTFKCPFDRWLYDPVFGPADVPKTKSTGNLKYVKPDKGKFEITEVQHYTPAEEPGGEPTWETKQGEQLERWDCDGKAVYEFNAAKKQLIVRELPPEMQGKAIADGPLPFLFGAKKDKLKARYWMRPMPQTNDKQIWIEAQPKFRVDAANFQKVELILDREKFLPSAIQLYEPNGKTRVVYMFGKETVNSPFEQIVPDILRRPRAPGGWKKVVIPAAAPVPQQEARGQRRRAPPNRSVYQR